MGVQAIDLKAGVEQVPVRDAHGRWLPGQTGNPNGRPKRSTEQEYLDVMLSTCTPDHWRDITAKAIEQAKRGEWHARKWLSDYILGPAIQRLELDVGTDKFEAYLAVLTSSAGEDPGADVGGGSGGSEVEGEFSRRLDE